MSSASDLGPGGPFGQLARLEGLPSAFAATRDGIDAVLRDRGLRRTTPEDTAASLALGAGASAVLEGAVLQEGAEVDLSSDPIAADVGQLYGELLGLVPVWKQSPVQALARMHALATHSGDDPDRGRPASAEGAQALRRLADDLRASAGAPGLVVAALVHARIATSQAFTTRTAVVARAAERLVLVATGVDPASVLVPEAAHAQEPTGYVRALEAFAAGTSAGAQQWLNYSSMALARAAALSPIAR